MNHPSQLISHDQLGFVEKLIGFELRAPPKPESAGYLFMTEKPICCREPEIHYGPPVNFSTAAAAAAVTSGRYTDNKASTLVPKHACSHGHTMIVVLNAGREGAANHGYRACGMLQGACCRVSCAHLRRYVGCALPHVLPPRSTWPSFHRACLTCRCELQGSGPPAG